MDAIDTAGLLLSLGEEGNFCQLHHGPGIKEEDYVAVNYIVLPIGPLNQDGKVEITDYLTLPICNWCEEGMLDPEWTLLICMDCCSSRWIWRKHAKLDYINKETGEPHDIIILRGCPDCTGEFKGVYFYNSKNTILE